MTKPIDDIPEEPPTKAAKQLRASVLGEVTGFACAIGAVYIAERMTPHQTNQIIESIARRLGKWRGTNAEIEKKLAHKVVDVGLMNVGGVVNMATQFTLHRQQVPESEREPLSYDLGRVITGRIGGTATAIGTLALAETFAPKLMNHGTTGAGKLLGNSTKSIRFAELALSNLVQSIGALAGNVPAQLLYDKVLGRDQKPER